MLAHSKYQNNFAPGQRAQDAQYLSADGVRRPEGHRESLTIATDVVTVVEDGVFGTEEYSRSTVRQVPAVWGGAKRDTAEERQECNRMHLQNTAFTFK